jgi:putative transposase
MAHPPIREKVHHLPREFYRGEISIAVTICLHNREHVLINHAIVDPLVEILADAAERTGCIVPVYCFMPDHHHSVIMGTDDFSDGWETICDFKQRSGFRLRTQACGVRWQKNFYDHIMREREDLAVHARYVLENPVRKGFISRWEDYPFSGSIGCRLNDVLSGLF